MTPMPHRKQQRKLMAFTLKMLGDLWATIVAPVGLLAWLGKTLDEMFSLKPWALITGMFLAFIISTVSLCHKALAYGEQYELLTGPPGAHDSPGETDEQKAARLKARAGPLTGPDE
jgi:F0F1-type ATP synthase assembly protein I